MMTQSAQTLPHKSITLFILGLMVLACIPATEDRTGPGPCKWCNHSGAVNEGLALQIQPDLSPHDESQMIQRNY